MTVFNVTSQNSIAKLASQKVKLFLKVTSDKLFMFTCFTKVFRRVIMIQRQLRSVISQRREEDQHIFNLYDLRRKAIIDFMMKRKVKEDWFDELRQKLLAIDVNVELQQMKTQILN